MARKTGSSELNLQEFFSRVSLFQDLSFSGKKKLEEGESVKLLDVDRSDPGNLVVCSPNLSHPNWKRLNIEDLESLEVISALHCFGKVYPLIKFKKTKVLYGACPLSSFDGANDDNRESRRVEWGSIPDISGDGDLHLQRAYLEYSSNGDFHFYSRVDYDSMLPDDYWLYVYFGTGPIVNGNSCRMEEYLHKEYVKFDFKYRDNGIYNGEIRGNRDKVREKFNEFNCFSLECVD